jgi:hypothetical protein
MVFGVFLVTISAWYDQKARKGQPIYAKPHDDIQNKEIKEQKTDKNKLVFDNVVCLKCASNFQPIPSPFLEITGNQAFVDPSNLGFVSGVVKCSSCGETHEYFFNEDKLMLSRVSVSVGDSRKTKVSIDPLIHLESTAAPIVANEENNLSRWKNSGWSNPDGPERWVEKHGYSWTHQDWLQLLEGLKGSSYWPMHEDAIGAVLEEVKRLNLFEIVVRKSRGFIDIICPSCGSKCPSLLLADDPVLVKRIWGADCPACGRVFNFKVKRHT